MKRLICALLLSSFAFAEPFQWPPEQVPVRVDGQLIPTVWKDGRPQVDREATLYVLHVRTGPVTLDLGEVLEEKGYTFTVQEDGSVDARRPVTAGAAAPMKLQGGGAGAVRPARRSTGRRRVTPQAARFKAELDQQRRRDATAPVLVASGYRYVADTTYIRAYVIVENQGASPSPACKAVGDFVDWYGHPFAQDVHMVPPLQPGESVEMTFFSMIREDETQPNGVIKADKYTCRVTFEDGNGSPYKSARSSARPGRSSGPYKGMGGSLDFKLPTMRLETSTVKITPGNQRP